MVNPNYNTRPHLTSRDNVAGIAPCVVWSLRAYFMLTDPLNNEKRSEQESLELRYTGRYNEKILKKLLSYNVSLPVSSTSTGEFNNLHFSELEQANNIAIIVYMLKKEKIHDKNPAVRHNLHCIRVPSLNTLKKYNFQNICHLLLLSPSHICYILNIEKYLRNTLGITRHNLR